MLAVLVVFIHNNYTDENIAKTFAETGTRIVFQQNAFGAWTQCLISNGIARCAVPLFFLFAAFLQAKKADPYPTLLKKKAKSLLLPYAVWMFLFFLYYGPLKLIISKIAPQLLEKPGESVLSGTASDWLYQFLGYRPDYDGLVFAGARGLPELAAQFWFVRDLIILTVLSPLIAALIKKIPAGFFALAASLFLLGIPVYFVQTQALFFYAAGLYWGMYEDSFLQKIDRIKWSEVVFFFLAAFAAAHGFYGSGGTCYSIMVLASCALALKLSKAIAEHEKAFALAARFARYSFFLFAIHMFLLNNLHRIWLPLFPMENAFFCLFEYFGVTLTAVALSCAAGAVLRKICPPLFSVLNGGRV